MENADPGAVSKTTQPQEIVLKLQTGEPPLAITILQPAENPSIHTILQDDILHRRTIFSKQLSTITESFNAYFVQTIDHLKTKRIGLLHKSLPFSHTYELFVFSLPDTINELQFTSEKPSASLTQDGCIEKWRVQAITAKSISETLNFSMKPPPAYSSPVSDRNAVITELSPQRETNPVNFLQSRYFSILYSLSTPLTYFPKTTLSRLRIMCEGDKKLLEESLASVYLDPEKLNERQSLRYGLDALIGKTSGTVEINKYEAENQSLLLQKHYSASLTDEARDKVIFDLKRREAQLQILVVMQLLLAWEVDESLFLSTNGSKQEKLSKKQNKKALVRKKSKSKKIIPTFLGVGIHEKEEETSKKKAVITQFGLYASLVSLVDQMSIWDVLTGRLKNKKDESMYGFLAYVFVPFFNNKLPHIVKFVIEKVKELRPNFKVPRLKSSRSRSETQSEAESPALPLSSAQSEESTLTENKKSSRFRKTLLSEDQKPFLRRAKTSMSEKEEPAFSLKRSKSNLGSKNLKRRQVDMSLNKPDDQVEDKSTSFLFGDARKIKTQSISAGTLRGSKALPEEPVKLIEATPSKNRVADVVLETPHTGAKRNEFVIPDSTKKRSLVQQKLSLLAAPSNPEMKIFSSPINNSSEKSPNLFLQHGNVQAHPSSVIESSPIQPEVTRTPKVTKQSELPDFKNPFMKATLQGSPDGRIFQTRKRAPRAALMPQNLSHQADILMSITGSSNGNRKSFQESQNLDKAPSIEFSKPGEATDVDSGANEGSDSDSDSEFEKLLATTSNRTLKTYVRPKRR